MENDIFSIDSNGNLIVTTWVDFYDRFTDIEISEEEEDKLYDFIDSLPNSSGFERIRKDKGIFTDWDDYARKGIIAYDNYYGNNPILTSNPTKPLHKSDIPSDILKILKKF